ncbi:MAG: hypothetical protein ACOY15_08925 [Pseudomonadota bacterium]
MQQYIQVQKFHNMLGIIWPSFYHIFIILLAFGIVFTLPRAAGYVLNDWWPMARTNTKLLLATEIGLSAVLVLLFNALKTVWESWRMSAAARQASLVQAINLDSLLSRRKAWQLMRHCAAARDVFILTLTGFDTFVKTHSLFNGALATAYDIRILLLNPASEAANDRVNAIPSQEVNLQSLYEETAASIAYLTSLHKSGKKVSLKFYEHEPVWKVAVLGNHVWVQHCHHGYEVKSQPQYVFALQHSAPRKGFFVPFYTYFLNHWNEPHHPEYDFDTCELVYRDKAGNETNRTPLLGPCRKEETCRTPDGDWQIMN